MLLFRGAGSGGGKSVVYSPFTTVTTIFLWLAAPFVIMAQKQEGGRLFESLTIQAHAAVAADVVELEIGSLATRAHNVAGEVYALSDRVLEIRNFQYDGQGPDTFFWVDSFASPTANGVILQDGTPYNTCGATKLPETDGNVTLHVEFAPGTSLLDYLGGSISVWCRTAQANFGEVAIPETLDAGYLSSLEGPVLECSQAGSGGGGNGTDANASGIPFVRPVIRNTTLVAHIGPSGGERGYQGITSGRTGWGIAWYINDELIPVIEMRRGTTYTFSASGGNDPGQSVEYHPFYLTTAIDGGYAQKSPEERAQETVLAGIEIVGQNETGVFDYNALAMGPICLYTSTSETDDIYDGATFDEYFASLDTSCKQNDTIISAAAAFEFTPDENTPDSFYYQCVTHRNLGWQVRLIDADAPEIPDTEVFLGALTTRAHSVAANVFALSESVLEFRNFVYDGEGPDTFFWADTSSSLTPRGFRLLDASPLNSCGQTILPMADGSATMRVELPEGITLDDLKEGTIGVWCRTAGAAFGDLAVPATLQSILPSTADGPELRCTNITDSVDEVSLGSFTTRAHNLGGDVFALSESVLEIRNFRYDGQGPAAYFWTDKSATASTSGIRLHDGAPFSTCGQTPLPQADGTVTVRVEFPVGMTIRDYAGGSISVWCELAEASFGQVLVPSDLEGLAITDVGPALECSQGGGGGVAEVPQFIQTPEGYNCEVLSDEFQVRWQVQGETLAVELIALIDDGTYMGFGVSGSDAATNMDGADPVIADMFQGSFRARDFFVSSRAQCSNGSGVCPDSDVQGQSEDATLVSGEYDADLGVMLVRYTRPLVPSDVGASNIDRPINVDSGFDTYIVWALGPIEPDQGIPFYHQASRAPPAGVTLEFGRTVMNNCSPLIGGTEGEGTPAPVQLFQRPFIRDTTELVARIGPSGGERGYEGLTGGRVGWGIAWYINDVLIPVIEMRRGTTYTFLISGGTDPDLSAEYHPFYLTAAIDGGYAQKDPSERANELVFAGIDVVSENSTGVFEFSAPLVAPICLYTTTDETDEIYDEASYREFFASLDRSCKENETIINAAATLSFTPDENTSDTIYYQCVTHRNLGWEVRVIDADAPSLLQLDCSNFRDTPIQLHEDLVLNAVIDPYGGLLHAELTLDGLGWVAMGFTAGAPVMVGSQAVIGIPNQPNGPLNPAKYNLNAQSLSGIQLMPDAQQTLRNATITQTDTQTVLRFSKVLIEDGELPIELQGNNTFLFAFGSTDSLSQHAATNRGGFTLTLNQCKQRFDGVDVTPPIQQFTEPPPQRNLYRKLWVAHGACASIAWAILVPLAIGASLVRGVLQSLGLPKDAWFQIHRGLNTLAVVLTIIAVFLAVAAISKTTPNGIETKHFNLNTHRKTGLVIFILAFLQAGNGLLRPHLPPAAHRKIAGDSDEDGASSSEVHADEEQKKSSSRVFWEYFHRLLGVTLIGLTWFQVQDGLERYSTLFDADDLKGAFWGVVGGIAGLVAFLYVYQTFVLKLK